METWLTLVLVSAENVGVVPMGPFLSLTLDLIPILLKSMNYMDQALSFYSILPFLPRQLSTEVSLVEYRLSNLSSPRVIMLSPTVGFSFKY